MNMVSQIKQCVARMLLLVSRKSHRTKSGFEGMPSAGCCGALKFACLVTLILGLAEVALSNSVPPSITLVPGITTVSGNGSQGLPHASPTLASSSQNILPIGITTDPAGNIYFADGQYNVVWKINRATGIMAIIAGRISGWLAKPCGRPA